METPAETPAETPSEAPTEGGPGPGKGHGKGPGGGSVEAPAEVPAKAPTEGQADGPTGVILGGDISGLEGIYIYKEKKMEMEKKLMNGERKRRVNVTNGTRGGQAGGNGSLCPAATDATRDVLTRLCPPMCPSLRPFQNSNNKKNLPQLFLRKYKKNEI